MSNETLEASEMAIPRGWQCALLDDLVDKDRGISYGVVQPGKHDDAGVPIVRVNNLRGGRVLTDDAMRVAADVESGYGRTRLRGGEILLSLVGTLGECAVVPTALAGWNVARAVAVIPLRQEVDADWVAMCLRSAEVQALVRAWATTTVQATLNLRDVRRLPILLAPEPDRSEITKVVKQLDDKIEQNRRTGRKLEELARAVFKAWFVDFEPVKAKAAGATAFPGMPPETFAALPDTFQDSPLGPVPKGWEVKPAIDVVSVAIGKTPPRKEPQWFSADPSNIPWASISDMRSCGAFIRDTSEYLTAESVDRFNVRRIPPGSVLFSFKLTVGRVAITDGEITSNEAIAHFVPASPDVIGPEYLYCYLSSFDHAQLGSTSSIATATNSKAIKAMPVLVPNVVTATSFTSTVRPLFDLIRSLSRESAKLASLRDYLLPRLLSGRVRVGGTNG